MVEIKIWFLFLIIRFWDFSLDFTERVTYMLFAQQQYVLNTHSTILAYELAVASSCTCFAAAAIMVQQNQQQQSSTSALPRPNTLTLSYTWNNHTKILREFSW